MTAPTTQIAGQIANRAFRRSALPQETDRLMTMFRRARKKGDSFRDALKLAMRAVMVSPSLTLS